MPPDEDEIPADSGVDPSSDVRPTPWVEALVLLIIGGLLSLDLVSDTETGRSRLHVALEAVAACMAVLALGWIWTRWMGERRSLEGRVGDLTTRLDQSRAEAECWKAESRDALAGLGTAIDAQFERWKLTDAERGVGLLLLKGLSLKEVAEARRTSERTVRQQALAIYKKAGLAGRAELAAFFLEDLLLPSSPSAPPTNGSRRDG
jgi:DNA-binding CsgD family transcriptional regulator